MKVNFVGNNLVQIDDCHICFRNFAGAAGKFNKAGERSFSIVIDNDEAKELLLERGFNVKIRPPREEGDSPFMYLPVKMSFNGRGPEVYLEVNGNRILQTEDTIGIIDQVDVESCSFDIRAYDWEFNGNTGTSAWLNGGLIIQRSNRFANSNNNYTNEDLPF